MYHWLAFREKRAQIIHPALHRVLFLRIFAALIRCLPLNFARFMARRLADFVYYVIPIRKKIVIGNLTEAFKDEKTPSEIRKIARKPISSLPRR